MDELDALLAEFNAKPVTTKKGSRPASTFVSPEELSRVIQFLGEKTDNKSPVIAAEDDLEQALADLSAELPPTPISGPTTESKNLDDLEALMESLSAPIASPSTPAPAALPPPPAVPPPSDDELDSLLENLNSQMKGVDTKKPVSRGTCFACGEMIRGTAIQVKNETYHLEHFTCNLCKKQLKTDTYYEVDGGRFCQPCYAAEKCPRCGHCGEPIIDRCLTAMGKKWHPNHFICCQCLQPFPNGTFIESNGKPYCDRDYYKVFAPKCGGCEEPIRGDCINAMGKAWHPDHFVCAVCNAAFTSGSFFEKNGKPYCEKHYS